MRPSSGLLGISVGLAIGVALFVVASWPASFSPHKPAPDGPSYRTESFVDPSPPPRVNCSIPVDQHFGLAFQGVNFTFQSWWTCIPINVTGAAAGQNGTAYTFSFIQIPPSGENATWYSPDKQFGVQLISDPRGGTPIIRLAVEVR